jgi:hypothetical protein
MTRTTSEIRSQIEQAAAQSGRSLAQEVERRLEQSFEPNALVNKLVLEVIYQIERVIRENKGKEPDLGFWVSMIAAVVEAGQEVGDSQFDSDRIEYFAKGSDALFKGAQRFDHKESAIDEPAERPKSRTRRSSKASRARRQNPADAEPDPAPEESAQV